MIDDTVGRVDILLGHSFRASIQQTAAESRHLTAHTYPREHHTPIETVDEFSVLTLETETCLYEKSSLKTCLQGSISKGMTARQTETQLELTDNVIPEAAAAEILHTDSHAVNIVVQDIFKIPRSPFVDQEHRLPLVFLLLLLRRKFPLVYLDVILVCKPLQGFGVSHLLMFHDELHHIARRTT